MCQPSWEMDHVHNYPTHYPDRIPMAKFSRVWPKRGKTKTNDQRSLSMSFHSSVSICLFVLWHSMRLDTDDALNQKERNKTKRDEMKWNETKWNEENLYAINIPLLLYMLHVPYHARQIWHREWEWQKTTRPWHFTRWWWWTLTFDQSLFINRVNDNCFVTTIL